MKPTDKDDEYWRKEIEMLERRTKQTTSVTLSDGTTVKIWGNPSMAKALWIMELERRRKAIGLEIVSRIDRGELLDIDLVNKVNDDAFEILEIMTVDPTMTKEWFRENQESFPVKDLLEVVLNYFHTGWDRVIRRRRGNDI